MSTFEPEQPLVPAPLFQSPEPPKAHVFVGPLGLRAGWGIALFLLLGILLTSGIGAVVLRATGQKNAMHQSQVEAAAAAKRAKLEHAPPAAQPMRAGFAYLQESSTVAGFLLAGLAMCFLERRRFGVYGLGLHSLGNFFTGAVSGLVALSALVGALRGLHLLVFDGRLLAGGAIARWGAAWLGLFLLVGLSEEFLFRGYVQFTLTRGLLGLARRLSPERERRMAFWMSAVFWSLLFLVAHLANAGENPFGLAGVFLAGLVFSYALWRTGSLWWGIGAHMTWDWAQSFLFGVPDSGTLSVGRLFQTHALGAKWLSGGVDGPEGSLLVLPAMLLLLLAVRLRPQGPQPALEPEPGTPRAESRPIEAA